MAKSVIKKSLPSRSLTHERQRASFGTCTLDMAYTSLGVDLIQKLYVAPLYVVPLCWERASFSTCALDMTYTSLGVDLIQKLCLVPLCLEGRFDRLDFGTFEISYIPHSLEQGYMPHPHECHLQCSLKSSVHLLRISTAAHLLYVWCR